MKNGKDRKASDHVEVEGIRLLESHKSSRTARDRLTVTTVDPEDSPPCCVQLFFVSTYLFAIIGLNAPQSMYPAMERDQIFTISDSADILGIQTLGTMCGKLFAGIFVDRVGSRKAYMISVAGLSISLFAMSLV